MKADNMKDGKKQEMEWKKPELTKLNIKETLGGPIVGADRGGRS
jgi:hypothetical protein